MFDVFSNVKEAKDIIKQAKDFLENSRAAEAIGILTPLLIKKPKYYEALVIRAEAYCILEKYESAIRDLNLAVKVNDFRIEAYFLRGQIQMLAENYIDALNDFNCVIKLDRRNALAYFKRGAIYLKLEMEDKAAKDFKSLVKLVKTNPHYFDIFLNTCFLCGAYNDIEKYSKKYIELYSDMPNGHFHLGRVLCTKEKYLESVHYLTHAIKKEENNYDYYYYRAVAYLGLKKYKKAIEDLTILLEINKSGEYYYLRGELYKDIKEYDKALEDFNLAIDYNYNVKKVNHHKGEVLMEKKLYSDAIFCFDKVVENKDYNLLGDIYSKRADCYKYLDDFQNAINDYEKAININPGVKNLYKELSDTYFKLGELEKAVETLNLVDVFSNIRGESRNNYSKK